ncbi:transporter substrate-binding domain-containing protein [Coralloluteibacterium thermophilus]|uniref:Transporter substrate-binding domain-containing protein n=1 Tax=Coralloluteibacterium thermophilum TaxID=2707049 RepID=A0ABV9NH23_9GAMM
MPRSISLLLLWLALAGVAGAQTAPAADPPGQMLLVGVRTAPPFVIETEDGYAGLAIELWEDIAAERGWRFEYRGYGLEGLLDAVAADEVDLGIGAVTATAERMTRMDFSHPITSSGLGVAVRDSDGAGWLALARAFASP